MVVIFMKLLHPVTLIFRLGDQLLLILSKQAPTLNSAKNVSQTTMSCLTSLVRQM